MVEILLRTLKEEYPKIYWFISVEPHKNSNLSSQKGKNRKAGAPHFDMVLWVAHKFLNSDQQ